MSKMKMIIDTDAGIDDAQAILMALNQEDVEVLAITTCHGNTSLSHVTANVIRVLQVAGKTQIPVYMGCDKALLGSTGDSSHYHGKDGLGDSPDPTPPDVSIIQSEHAVLQLMKLARQFPGEITLVCLAPLTNIAMAIRLDSTFGDNLKQCFIMGGNYEGKGNITMCAEFNFHTDAEAADIVLREMNCPLTLACWELCLKYSFTMDWYNKMVGGENKESKFMKRVEATTIQNNYSEPSSRYVTADQIIMAAALNRDLWKGEDVTCQVELHGKNTRGQLCIDWKSEHNRTKKLKLITELNHDMYGDLLFSAIRK